MAFDLQIIRGRSAWRSAPVVKSRAAKIDATGPATAFEET